MSATTEPGTKSVPLQITEDEAAVYDRQIRLWGLEAQQRMRNATILVVRLKGVATEAIKNIVLAGIGTLIIMDSENVSEEDLGAGFFFRDEDVGKKRVDVAKARIQSLNPLVTVQTMTEPTLLEAESLDALVMTVDLVCVTDFDREGLFRINEVCRRFKKPFYAGGTFGLLGYIFCDLLKHDYIAPDRSAPKEATKNIKNTLVYSPMYEGLNHKWSGLTRKQTRELNPAVVFTVLALWEYESKHGRLPDDPKTSSDLDNFALAFLAKAEVNKQAITAIPRDLIETIAVTAAHEISPVCAVVGGMLAQDILKALAAREAPIANFFTFDGSTGGGTVCRLNMP
ncbi:ubiquitin-activating E1 family protein [Abortiporus biennis]